MTRLRNRYACLLLIISLPLFMLGCGEQSTSNANENPVAKGNPDISAPVYDFDEFVASTEVDAAGFDLDDTLLFSSPAFNKGFNNAEEPFSAEFWRIVNSSDEGNSCVKPTMVDLLERHRDAGHEIYIITARERYNSDVLKDYASDKFDIPSDHVFLEPDGKTERLTDLGIDVYYGDSDSDISDAQDGNIKGVRVLRSPESGYDAKHNPGKYDEPYVPNSAPPHSCSE